MKSAEPSRTIVRIIARLNVGGPAQQAVWLSAKLRPPAWRTVLVVGQLAQGEADMSDLASRYGIAPLVIPQLGRSIRPWDDLTALIAIARILWREQPDLVHTHTAKAGALGRVAAWWYNLWHRSRRCRVVHTFHGHVFAGYFGRWMTRGFVWIERWLSTRTDRIIAVSDRVRREVLSLGVGRSDQVVVVPLGLELDPFLRLQAASDEDLVTNDQRPATIDRQLTISDQRPETNGWGEGRRDEGRWNRPATIGIVGRLVPVKNHRMFLDAARLVSRVTRHASRFLVVGDGELRQELERYAASIGLNGSVSFLGWRRDLPQLYQEIDVVTLTSWNEGSPVSLIEAMAAGRPVVATDVGGVRELLSGGDGGKERRTSHVARRTTCDLRPATGYEMLPRGLLVPSGDTEAFAAALQRLIEDEPLRRELGATGRRFVESRYHLERLVADIERLYGELLGEGHWRSAISGQPSAQGQRPSVSQMISS